MEPYIPFANPHAAYAERATAIHAAITRVLEGGIYILGPEVEAFEREFAAWLGQGEEGLLHAVGVGNGTDALELPLRAHFSLLGLSPAAVQASAVFTVSHTAVATVAAIERAGAVPVLVDVEPEAGTLAPAALEQAVHSAVKAGLCPRAVVPVHIYGQPCRMDAIAEVARRHDLFVLEDCAQAHGARYARRRVGTWGHAAAFSCYPTKNLGALGDAGVVVTSDAALADKMAGIRQYGWKERYSSDVPGINSRLDPVQAAILRVQMQYLDADVLRRQAIAQRYDAGLAGCGLHTPSRVPLSEHAFHLYVVRQKDKNAARRDALLEALRARGVGAALHYPLAVHQQPAYAHRILTVPHGLPATTALYTQIMTLPLYPQMEDRAVQRVIDAAVACATAME